MIVPIFKDGDVSMYENYRVITLLKVVHKLMSSII